MGLLFSLFIFVIAGRPRRTGNRRLKLANRTLFLIRPNCEVLFCFVLQIKGLIFIFIWALVTHSFLNCLCEGVLISALAFLEFFENFEESLSRLVILSFVFKRHFVF